jgi:uncharacterized membrane protein
MRLSPMLAVLALVACAKEPERPAAAPRPPSKVETGSVGEPVPLSGVDLRGDINAVGTEPFWAVEIRKDHLKVTGVDMPERTAPNRGVRLRGPTASWTSTTDTGEALSVILAEGQCSDGMSDRVYPLSALVTVGDQRFTGCAASAAFILQRGESGGGEGSAAAQ